MSFRMNLWKVDGSTLKPVPTGMVDVEQRLEDWIADDAGLTGLDILVIGRQVVTPNRGRVDLLADNVKYGYLGAGGGEWYSSALLRLRVGDRIFAYMRQFGYVGFGEVTEEAQPASNVRLDDGRPLLDHPMVAPHPGDFGDDHTKAEWAVRVKWLKTFPREQARTFNGVFANQNVTCKLRHPETVAFVEKEFDVAGRPATTG
jgi:hypothetical protein